MGEPYVSYTCRLFPYFAYKQAWFPYYTFTKKYVNYLKLISAEILKILKLSHKKYEHNPIDKRVSTLYSYLLETRESIISKILTIKKDINNLHKKVVHG